LPSGGVLHRLPANLKLRGLTEKYLLKKLGQAGFRRKFGDGQAPLPRSNPPQLLQRRYSDYVRELLSPEKISSSRMFNPTAVSQLVRKIDQGLTIGETDDMALPAYSPLSCSTLNLSRTLGERHLLVKGTTSSYAAVRNWP